MLRRDVDQATKIRKRCALSPSSQDPRRTTRRRLRLKRGVRLIGRSGCGGASSPCKISGGGGGRRRKRMSESSWSRHHRRVETRPTSAASARKLVSALWQLDKGPGACGEEDEEGEVGWDAAAARRSSDHRRSASVEFSKLSRRKSRALEGDGERSWHNGHAHGHWFSDVMSNGGTMEAHACAQGLASPCPGDRTAPLQELHNSLTASKELVRVLANVLAPSGALNPTAASLLAALRSELDAARARARRLVREQRRFCGGGSGDEDVRTQLAEEMRAWKSRHREKAAAAARLVASELDAERRSRQRAERVGKKLGEALAAAEASLREARRELELERESRERLEKVCDELAADVGGGLEEEEEELLRREAAREELEREREMLQLADELREERVRMKLAEARVQFEEKNAVVDRLRQELEAFLGHSDKDGHGSPPARDDDDRRLQLVLASSEPVVDGIDRVAVHEKNRGDGDRDGSAGGGEVDDDDDSDGSDIELNMDGNSWSYSTAASNKETAAAMNNHAASRSSRHGSFSDRGTDDRRSQGLGEEALEQQNHHWDEGRCSDDDDDDDRTTARDADEDAERYEAIKNLREQMLAGHGFVFLSQGGADADDHRDDRHRHGLACQVQDTGLW